MGYFRSPAPHFPVQRTGVRERNRVPRRSAHIDTSWHEQLQWSGAVEVGYRRLDRPSMKAPRGRITSSTPTPPRASSIQGISICNDVFGTAADLARDDARGGCAVGGSAAEA